MPILTINGTEIEVEKGTSILQAAEMAGYEIPRFCYHDRLSVPANCRMCLVEVKGGPPKPVASCAMACTDGMEVLTDSTMVRKARKGVMEFLLINHPLDCPICDQGGECDLQDQAMAYGFDRSRYYENKRAVKDKQLGPLIKTVMTRCIHCTRCVRFADEIGGVSELGLLNRGEDVEIGTMVDKLVTTELSGNMIDICPVGALTSKPYAFQARPWELVRTETIDVHDAVGSNIRVDARGGEVKRTLPRLHEEINEEWISDKTRFAYDGLLRQRLDKPYVRDQETKRLRPASWEEALNVVAEQFKSLGAFQICGLAGDLVDVESVVALKDMLNALGSQNHECRVDGSIFDASARCGYIMNTGIAGLEDADAILLIGTNPRWEAVMVNARIRKTWLARRIPIGLIGEKYDLTYPYHYMGNDLNMLSELRAGKGDFARVLKNAERPAVIVGMGTFQRPDGAALQAMIRDLAEQYGMIKDGWNGFNILHTAAGRVGALDVGFTGAFDLDRMKAIYLLNIDSELIDMIPHHSFVVYQGHHGDRGAMRADVILPGAAYTEKNALYVNTEGRLQMAARSVYPPGEAREDWKILRALSAKMGLNVTYNDIFELRERIAREWPHLGMIDVRPDQTWVEFGDRDGSVDFITPVFSPIRDFYLTNVICSSSETMVNCSHSFIHGDDNAAIYKQAAE